MSIQRIAVYCASSDKTDPEFQQAARRLGECLARERVTIVYGGGRVGSMGQLADGALSEGGYVVGVIPNFMAEIEWGHTGVNELHIVDDMHGRKRLMLERADAVVALPGGTGTFEELLEAITLKRLGIFLKPIILVNTRRFYDRFQELMDYCVVEKFMSPRHLKLWQVVDQPEEVLPAILQTPPWNEGDLQGAMVS
ncbi:MAG: TIGR00730 family Rossman fold protein [Planctomycetaceae bacterium]|jgi:uncharacterized protein (TIGR00730 family)